METGEIDEILKRGFDHQAAGEFAAAGRCYVQVLNDHPAHANAHHLLGRLNFEIGNRDFAIQLMKQAAALEPANPKLHHNLGLAYVFLRKLEEARPCFEEAIRLQPDYAEAHNNLGCVLRALNLPGEALACFREALRLRPDFAEARKNFDDIAAQQEKDKQETLADHLARALARWQVTI
jgi:tetratricopeptide (TPR) repeat protein